MDGLILLGQRRGRRVRSSEGAHNSQLESTDHVAEMHGDDESS